jgi:phage gpG-like protein
MAKAPVRIDVEVRVEKVQNLIDDVNERCIDARPVFRWAQQVLKKTFAENFTSQGLAVGGWSPLDAEYAAWKARDLPGRPTLVRSGELFRSISELSDPSVNEINRLSATFGTGVKYAGFHQYGTSKMPKRQILFIPQSFADEFAEKLANYIVEGNEGLTA